MPEKKLSPIDEIARAPKKGEPNVWLERAESLIRNHAQQFEEAATQLIEEFRHHESHVLGEDPAVLEHVKTARLLFHKLINVLLKSVCKNPEEYQATLKELGEQMNLQRRIFSKTFNDSYKRLARDPSIGKEVIELRYPVTEFAKVHIGLLSRAVIAIPLLREYIGNKKKEDQAASVFEESQKPVDSDTVIRSEMEIIEYDDEEAQ